MIAGVLKPQAFGNRASKENGRQLVAAAHEEKSP
jgi:hypothetical protein